MCFKYLLFPSKLWIQICVFTRKKSTKLNGRHFFLKNKYTIWSVLHTTYDLVCILWEKIWMKHPFLKYILALLWQKEKKAITKCKWFKRKILEPNHESAIFFVLALTRIFSFPVRSPYIIFSSPLWLICPKPNLKEDKTVIYGDWKWSFVPFFQKSSLEWKLFNDNGV